MKSSRTSRAGSLGLLAAACLSFLAAGAVTSDRMAFVTQGKGSPTIVLIHSIGGDRSDWARVAPALAQRHRVLLVDLPGHGQSPPPAKANVAEAGRLLEQVLARNKVTDAILVGHSYGALVALEVAAAKPKRAAGVITIDAATFNSADSSRIANVELLLRDRYELFLVAIYRPMSRDPAQADSLVARASRVKQEVLSEYFRDAWREDLRPRIKTMKTPVHVVVTTALWPAAESWTSARARLGYDTAGPAQGYRIEDSAHHVAMDRPDSLIAVMERIAERTPR